MKNEFYRHIFDKHQGVDAVPSNKEIAGWASRIIHLLYPQQAKRHFPTIGEIEREFKQLEEDLVRILNATTACNDCNNHLKAKKFFEDLPELYKILNTDVEALLSGDPAAKSEFEVIRAYPGFFAISFYRIAHVLSKLDIPVVPRILTEYAHSRTGIDIHPGAKIGEYFFIDHGTGIVVGETVDIGMHVKLYQGVTLGALSVDKNMASTKRHPTVEDYVVIYSGATILGGETTIGHHSIIGGNVWLTRSVPAWSTVYNESQFKIVERKIQDY